MGEGQEAMQQYNVTVRGGKCRNEACRSVLPPPIRIVSHVRTQAPRFQPYGCLDSK